MSLPTAQSKVRYNGVVFPTETETTSIDIRPHYDSAGRTVIYNVYSITLRAIVAADNLVGAGTATALQASTLEGLRRALTKPGGEMEYNFLGLGKFWVNKSNLTNAISANPDLDTETVTYTNARDAVWGPKPRMLQWKPLGYNRACEIVWHVDVAVPDCEDAKYERDPMEFCYRLSYDVDSGGYTTRIYTGHVAIPQSRITVGDPRTGLSAISRTLQDQADRLREQITPPLIPGFRRIPGSFQLSEDKCRLDFTIRDEQMPPNIPPAGVVEVSASHSVTTTHVFSQRWINNLDATYEMERNDNKSRALHLFMELVNKRAFQASTVTFAGRKTPPLFMNFSMREPEIYGRRCAAFSISWLCFATLKDVVKATGIWLPVGAAGDWSSWSTSLNWNPRGNAKLKFQNADDAIIDLCDRTPPATPNTGGEPTGYVRVVPPFNDIVNETPPAETSYLHFWSRVWIEDINEVVELKKLPATPQMQFAVLAPVVPAQKQLQAVPSSSASSSASADPKITVVDELHLRLSGASGPPASDIQIRAKPTIYAHFTGVCIRAGHRPPAPSLRSIGGVPVQQANRPGDGVMYSETANLFGLTVITCAWHLRYILPEAPKQAIKVPTNAMFNPGGEEV